jgi:hypothetical protein
LPADKKPYLIINLILAGLIGLIFIYSGLFSAQRDNYPLPSFYEEITGSPSPSAGMSKAFSEIIRGRPGSALDYNPDSLLIFAFFLIQGMQRITVLLLLIRGRISVKYVLFADCIFSGILFLCCFQGQIRAMIRVLTQS